MFQKAVIDRNLAHLGQLAPGGYYIALHLRFAAALMTFSSYDHRWADRYTEQAYALRDPMVAWGFSTEGATRWSEITLPDPFGIMKEAGEYGLKYGVAVSVGPIKSRTIAGVARADREFDDEEIATIAAIIRDLHQLTEPPESLTAAQIEALRLVAAGYRHTAAAAKLGISESALKARLNSVRTRLMARTTAEALQRAKDYRLL